jgi:hypothetical protein
MNRVELLLHAWEHQYEKEDWHPPLGIALAGVTEAQANWRPTGNSVNTIWENVAHLTFYKERMLQRWNGTESDYPEGMTNDDTFAVTGSGEAAWEEAVARLRNVHLAIQEAIAGMRDEEVDRVLVNRSQPLGIWIHNLVVHDAYHAGQIVQLRKLQDAWPARES